MDFYVDLFGQIFAIILFFGFFFLSLLVEIFLRRAFKEIGKGNATREQRIITLYRIYKDEIECKKLQENTNFKIAYSAYKWPKFFFISFCAIYLVAVTLKHLT